MHVYARARARARARVCVCVCVCVTESVKTGLIRTSTEIYLLSICEMLQNHEGVFHGPGVR